MAKKDGGLWKLETLAHAVSYCEPSFIVNYYNVYSLSCLLFSHSLFINCLHIHRSIIEHEMLTIHVL